MTRHRWTLMLAAFSACLSCGDEEALSPDTGEDQPSNDTPPAVDSGDDGIVESDKAPTPCAARVVFDAGSTGTRAYLYRLSFDEQGAAVGIDEAFSVKVTPGLSELVGDPDQAAEAVVSLLTAEDEDSGATLLGLAADDACPAGIPVDVMATGGMRDAEAAAGAEAVGAVYDAIRDALVDAGTDPGFVGTISGEDEAVYLWVAANQASSADAMGVLELGGASAQIAFASTEGANTSVRFGGKHVDLYAYSYQGYGSDAAQEKWGVNSCFPPGYENGTGDYEVCATFTDVVVSPQSCDHASCGLADPMSTAGVPQPALPEGMPFFATSSFAYTHGFLELPETAAPVDFAAAGAVFCATPWEEIVGYWHREDPRYLAGYCFASAWIPSVLKGVGFAEDTDALRFGHDLDGVPVQWAQGAAFCAATDCR